MPAAASPINTTARPAALAKLKENDSLDEDRYPNKKYPNTTIATRTPACQNLTNERRPPHHL